MGAAAAAAPDSRESGRSLPEYLPARMVNEFTYCPRLFFLEWVEGLFAESADTVEGAAQHARVDKPGRSLPGADDIGEDERLQTRSVTLSSERLAVIAKMDVLDVEGGCVTPVDYKHGKPRDSGDGLGLWPADRVQLGVQALVLRENGYRCEEAVVFYQKTRQRVRVAVDAALVEETERAVAAAWETARGGELPPPLEDSPKCPGCSLVSICLPDETNRLAEWEEPSEAEQLALFPEAGPPRKKPGREMGRAVRRMVSSRDDRKPVYLNTPGLRVGKSGEVLQVKEKEALRQEIRLHEVNQVNLMGNVQISTQAVQTLCEAGIPVGYFSMGGWFYGMTTGMNTKNVFLRRRQFDSTAEEWPRLELARRLVAGKVRNQRTLLMRNHVEPRAAALEQLKEMARRAEAAQDLGELLGLEGNAGRVYFGEFDGMLKAEDGEETPAIFRLDFAGRNRRPPRDAVNALLSLGYSVLAKDLTIACYAVGFDPMMGFYHEPRFGRPALALDLMEPFRPLVVDSAVINAINTKMVTPRDFVVSGRGVALRPEGRKAFFRAYELRMDTLVTHPLFDYRVSYRRLLEIQTRLLGKWLEGEIAAYPVFVTR
ncbi:MAG: CRISPR-associated endonuclease Cas1 [Bryobacteraceae bacterium]